ncbi:hypothetical protein CAJAP_04748 [Camponotus japonicus]
MKVLLIVVVLLVAVEAHQGWPFYGPGVGYGRGNKPGRGPWAYPQQQNPQNNLFDSDVEWVCQNPKTNDIMIIATDNTRRDYPGREPWQWQNPPGHQGQNRPGHHQHGNQWTQPIITQQEPINTHNNNNNQLPPLFPQTSETPNNNNNYNDNQSQTTPRYHGGEGMIDIRVAP